MGTDGNLYFSNALQNDSRPDYCCYASFPRIRTIVQKTAVAVVVKSCRFTKQTDRWEVTIHRNDKNQYSLLSLFFQDHIFGVFCTAYQEYGLALSCLCCANCVKTLDWAIDAGEVKPSLPVPVLFLLYFVFIPVKAGNETADSVDASESHWHIKAFTVKIKTHFIQYEERTLLFCMLQKAADSSVMIRMCVDNTFD